MLRSAAYDDERLSTSNKRHWLLHRGTTSAQIFHLQLNPWIMTYRVRCHTEPSNPTQRSKPNYANRQHNDIPSSVLPYFPFIFLPTVTPISPRPRWCPSPRTVIAYRFSELKDPPLVGLGSQWPYTPLYTVRKSVFILSWNQWNFFILLDTECQKRLLSHMLDVFTRAKPGIKVYSPGMIKKPMRWWKYAWISLCSYLESWVIFRPWVLAFIRL